MNNTNNIIREHIRTAFPTASNFIFEHLAHNYFKVRIEVGCKFAELTSRACLENQIDEVSPLLIARLNERLVTPPSTDFQTLLTTIFNVDEPLPNIDQSQFKDFKETMNNLGCDEDEIAESNTNIIFSVANRKWLRDNNKLLSCACHATKFHELANILRRDTNISIEELDAQLHIVFETSSCEI